LFNQLQSETETQESYIKNSPLFDFFKHYRIDYTFTHIHTHQKLACKPRPTV